ncbi:uncharacterized protein LOC132749285 [Ruditapes philippinarum]|uniref:uncharacterized protein LOC132749285 n=1 Tax=Ruditapes philippinarum TaxID=129788 RepID=UPI00295A9730|nr:uncharacterized protein LOC132749285 [Ruditapes philippinarum]
MFCHIAAAAIRNNYYGGRDRNNYFGGSNRNINYDNRYRNNDYGGPNAYYSPPSYQPPIYPTPIPPHVDPGTTPDINKLSEDERQAQGQGVRVPPNDCVISWHDFQQKIANQEMIGLYGIDDDNDINPGVAFKFTVRWSVENDTMIRRRGSLWFSETKSCIFADGVFQRIDGDRAIFRSVSGNAFITDNRMDYFVWSKREPIQWCIFFICYDSQNVRDGRCPNSELVAVFREQRTTDINDAGIREGPIILNDIDWSELESTFKDCFSQEIKDDQDPQIFWGWRTPNNEACAVPGTPAFEEGARAG